MNVLLGLGVFLFGAGFFTQRVSQARQSAWAGPRTSGMRQRASHGGQRPVRHEVKLAWAQARATDWLEQQRHHRKNGTPATPGTAAASGVPGGKPAAVTPIAAARQRLAARKNAPAAQSRSPAAPHAPPQHVSKSPGRNTTVAGNGSTGSVEKFVEGVNQIHAEAQSGGIHAKHSAILASHEGSVRFSGMAAMLSRAMSEPGSNYGPEITEPVAKAGTHLQAAAMAFGEADAALTALMGMTVGDLANSARQAPHHAELSENGSR